MRGALQDYTLAISINPSFALAFNNRGILRDEYKNPIGAIEDYNEAIVLNPKNAAAYNNRGFAKFNCGDQDGAYLDWSKAAELGLTEGNDNIKKYCKKYWAIY